MIISRITAVSMLFLIYFNAGCQQIFDSSKIKKEDFKKYLELYQTSELPFSTYNELFCPENIDSTFVKLFICNNKSCLIDWNGYNIEFGPCRLLITNENFVAIIHDESTDCGTIRKLSTYDYYGNKITDLEIFADKSFHGQTSPTQISYFSIESIINKDLSIKKDYFEKYTSFIEGNKRVFFGRHIEYSYQIKKDGNLDLVSKNDHGKQKYEGEYIENGPFPKFKAISQ